MDRFEGKQGQETHRMGCSTTVCVSRVGALMRDAARCPSAWMVGRRGARGQGEAHGGDVRPDGRSEAAGGVEVFTVESVRRRLWARQRIGLRMARVDGWSLADGDRWCGKEDATPRQSAT
jgi:hypothetical protein